MRQVAFLRGMNLGKRRLSNEELCAAFEAIGCEDVAAFLASGNVVFMPPKGARDVEAHLATGLEEELGYPVPTYVRTPDELARVAQTDPFAGRRGAQDRGKLQLGFCPTLPKPAARKSVLALESDADWLALEGRALFWLPKGGLSQSELDTKTIERALGGLTVRTMNTVQRLLKKFF